jgi:hypothetical protein
MGDNKVIKAHYSEAERTLSPVLITPTIHGNRIGAVVFQFGSI